MPEKITRAPAIPGDPGPIELPPAIAEMIALLPAPGTAWPMAERLLWIRAFAAVADVVYGHDPNVVIAAVAK